MSSQRGFSLFEALIACLVLAIGVVGLARLQSQQRTDADNARLHTQALRLAQDEIERLRGPQAFASIRSASHIVTDEVEYRIDTAISPLVPPRSIEARVVVLWTDRRGAAQRVELHTIVTDATPALQGAVLSSAQR